MDPLSTEEQLGQYARMQQQKELELRHLSLQRTKQLETLLKNRDVRIKELQMHLRMFGMKAAA